MAAVEIQIFALAALAVTFGWIWLRDREPGLVWIALGFVLAAVWYGMVRLPPIIGSPPLAATWVERAMIAASVWAINAGVVLHLGWPRGWLKALVIACWIPAPVLVLADAAGMLGEPYLFWFQPGVLLCYVGSIMLALRRHAEDRRAGHWLLGLMLLLLPLISILIAIPGSPISWLRELSTMPRVVFGLILLSLILLQRRQRLEAEICRRARAEESLQMVNAELEARVQQRTEHLQELIQGLEGFNRSVSHDLRGPLSGMATLAHMAETHLREGKPDFATRALSAIAAQADESARLVDALLQLARAGQQPLNPGPVELGELVRAAFDEVVLGLGGKPAPTLQCGRLPRVEVDAALLRRALVNLLSNAAKFSRQVDSPRISVDARVDGRSVTVTVRDNGVGIDAAVADQLFRPFYRGHANQFEGHGLGLSIVRCAVERHGGKVWAEGSGAVGQTGAAFHFTLPNAALPGPAAGPEFAAI
ncbi:MAG: HAMP domain-containing histidine kinase [Rubrivivax sp.]|nr:HAMP domain-containing histidine kinase [Rubrivivax sp.]